MKNIEFVFSKEHKLHFNSDKFEWKEIGETQKWEINNKSTNEIFYIPFDSYLYYVQRKKTKKTDISFV